MGLEAGEGPLRTWRRVDSVAEGQSCKTSALHCTLPRQDHWLPSPLPARWALNWAGDKAHPLGCPVLIPSPSGPPNQGSFQKPPALNHQGLQLNSTQKHLWGLNGEREPIRQAATKASVL